MERNYKTYLEIKGLLDNLTEDNFDEFIDICANINFENYLSGKIVEKEHISDNLKYFLSTKELRKVEYLSWMLNTYYPNTTEELFESFLSNEQYELCELFKDLKNTQKMPIF
jgi:hypothetical protein